MTIQGIATTKSGFCQVQLDNGSSLVLHEEIVARRRLRPGLDVDEREVERWHIDALRRRSRERAYYLLESRDYGEVELYKKLCQTYPKRIAAETVAKCKEYGLLNDEAYVKKLSEYYLRRKLFSRRRALKEMLKKGLNRELSEEGLDALQVDPLWQMEKLIEKRYARLLQEGESQKVFAAFVRLGFDYDDIKSALRAFEAENEDE